MNPKIYYTNQKQKWDKLANTWLDTGPPASPSAEDVDNYRKLLKERLLPTQNGRIVILGSTPKLRDMFSQDEQLKQFEVVCVDFSSLMYERTSQIVREKNPNERFVLANWLTFDVGHRTYDAILGDKVIDNIMPDDWETFFQRVHYHLRVGGYFIAHLALADEQFKTVTFKSALSKWGILYSSGTLPLGEAVSGLWEDVLTASAFKGGNTFNTVMTGRFSSEVQELQLLKENLVESEAQVFNEFMRVFWPTNNDEWSSYGYDEIIERLSRYFQHDSTIYSTDYNVAHVQPIIRMRAI